VYNHFCESMDQKILMSNMEQAGSHLDDARNNWWCFRRFSRFIYVNTLTEKENMAIAKSIV